MNKTEREKADNILYSYYSLKKKIKRLEEGLEILNDRKKEYPVLFSSEEGQAVYNKAKSKLLKELEKEFYIYEKISCILNDFPEIVSKIIEDRYSKCYTWVKITMENHVSITYCHCIRRSVLERILKEF